jgi:hypothetical protein
VRAHVANEPTRPRRTPGAYLAYHRHSVPRYGYVEAMNDVATGRRTRTRLVWMRKSEVFELPTPVAGPASRAAPGSRVPRRSIVRWDTGESSQAAVKGWDGRARRGTYRTRARSADWCSRCRPRAGTVGCRGRGAPCRVSGCASGLWSVVFGVCRVSRTHPPRQRPGAGVSDGSLRHRPEPHWPFGDRRKRRSHASTPARKPGQSALECALKRPHDPLSCARYRHQDRYAGHKPCQRRPPARPALTSIAPS